MILLFLIPFILSLIQFSNADDIIGCGGFIKSEVEINFSLIEVKLYTKQGSLKYQTDCSPNNGYYMLPVYNKGEYVLKVEAPSGWTFEPMTVDLIINGKTDKCTLSEDINFQFTGFGVIGKVISRGQMEGPVGVEVSLKNLEGKENIRKTISGEGGSYAFEKVLPGEYEISAKHDIWKFDQDRSSVSVNRQTGNIVEPLVLSGYDIRGKILGDKKPVTGVNFLLFSKQPLPPISGCDSNLLNDLPEPENMSFACGVVSTKEGIFYFPSIPTGKYTMIPFYQGEKTRYDVSPNSLDIEVGQKSLIIENPFTITGFLATGKVLFSKEGKGIPNAEIFINEKLMGKTDMNGVYRIEGVKTGHYKLISKVPNVEFKAISVKVSPDEPVLPDLIASGFQVCGKIVMDKPRSNIEGESAKDQLSSLSLPSRQVEYKLADGEKMVKLVVSDDKGKFCGTVERGTYLLSVKLTEEEIANGMRLMPLEIKVNVENKPIDDITFSQFYAKVTGRIECLESCGVIHLLLTSMTRSEDSKTIEVSSQEKSVDFNYEDVMSGSYKLKVLKDTWCWKEKSIQLLIVDKNVNDLLFIQLGYVVVCSISHPANLKFQLELPKSESTNITQTHEQIFDSPSGSSKFCLHLPGLYNVVLTSCHKFSQESYQYKTSASSILTLSAISYRVHITVTTTSIQNDIIAEISYLDKDSQSPEDTVLKLGPFLLNTIKENEDKNVSLEQKSYNYVYQYWQKPEKKIKVTLLSGQLLFQPTSQIISINTDTCPGASVNFMGRQGVFIEGYIQNNLEGVEVNVIMEDKELKTFSGQDGKYKIGPVDADIKYKLAVSLSGYTFQEIDNKSGHFISFKLAKIIIEATDIETGQALAGVLLSLSGSNKFRRNNVTTNTGVMTFVDLNLGEYFLKPMMKEYDFNPSSNFIKLEEGANIEIKVSGKRVAYSCYGSVVSLNGEAENGVFIEAVGLHPSNCTVFQEESKTELDGSFRIRGLKPGCLYSIRMKEEEGLNPLMERTSPKNIQLEIGHEDITNIKLIGFRKINQMDISGRVVVSQEFVSTIKVFLFQEDSNQDSPVYSLSLGLSPFFYFSSIPIDNQSYILRIKSTLSRSSYDFNMPEIKFKADSVFKHFSLEFTPQRKANEQDLTHSSFIVLPLIILVLFACYHHQKVLPFLKNAANSSLAYLSSAIKSYQNGKSIGGSSNSGNTKNNNNKPNQSPVRFAGYYGLSQNTGQNQQAQNIDNPLSSPSTSGGQLGQQQLPSLSRLSRDYLLQTRVESSNLGSGESKVMDMENVTSLLLSGNDSQISASVKKRVKAKRVN